MRDEQYNILKTHGVRMATQLYQAVVQLDHYPRQKLKGEQVRRGEIEGTTRIEATDSKVEQ